ncbi:MAG: ribosome silencing factor [Erysipelotrichaceae bacterium]|nr:ribosome silencing factor [Erysipelotrichaceae bacterium]
MADNLKELYKLLDAKQADDITVLDFRKNSPFVDYFIVCSARNSRLANAIIGEVEDYADINDIKVFSKDVNKDGKWLLIDIGSIVVHVFVGEERFKYNLDGLWKDLIIEI